MNNIQWWKWPVIIVLTPLALLVWTGAWAAMKWGEFLTGDVPSVQ